MSATHLAVRKPRRKPPAPNGTANLLRPELFFPALDVASRDELLAALVDTLARIGVAQHRDALLDALLERERLGTTALGRGVALPHARSMVVGSSAIAFARTRGEIDFGATPDGLPVRLVFLVVAPYGTSGAAYLPAVAAIARTVRNEARRSRLLELDTFDELQRLVGSTLVNQEEVASQ